MCRTEAEIDWKKVDDLMVSGCPGTEIAAYFGIHPDTFYKRVEKQYNMGFSAYLHEKRSKGEALLRAKQFAKALGLSKDGDNMMLIWLGKNRLGQKENHEPVVSPFQADLNKDDIIFKQQAELALLKKKAGDDASE